MLKAIHASESRPAALKKAADVELQLREVKLGKVADWVAETVEETLSYYAFPDEHWRRIRTNNPLERIMREIRRRTRVAGAFPRRPMLSQLGCRPPQAHCRHQMVVEALYRRDDPPGGPLRCGRNPAEGQRPTWRASRQRSPSRSEHGGGSRRWPTCPQLANMDAFENSAISVAIFEGGHQNG